MIFIVVRISWGYGSKNNISGSNYKEEVLELVPEESLPDWLEGTCTACPDSNPEDTPDHLYGDR